MDQKKQGQQSEGFKGQQQRQHQGSQQPGSQRPGSRQPGERTWDEPQTQSPDREPAEGPGNMPDNQEKGRGQDGEVTNRDLDREMDEQDELPDRGTSRDQSER